MCDVASVLVDFVQGNNGDYVRTRWPLEHRKSNPDHVLKESCNAVHQKCRTDEFADEIIVISGTNSFRYKLRGYEGTSDGKQGLLKNRK